jgi:hypothetical protein
MGQNMTSSGAFSACGREWFVCRLASNSLRGARECGSLGYAGPVLHGLRGRRTSIADQHLDAAPCAASGSADLPLPIGSCAGTGQWSYDPGERAAGERAAPNGRIYDLSQFHFHDPSEHRVDGRTYPMEIHLVHQDRKGHAVVIGLLVEVGSPNQPLAELWTMLPMKA